MNANDLVYPWVDTRPMCVLIERLEDHWWWDWSAAKYAAPAIVWDPKRFVLAMAKSPYFPTSQNAIIPAAAASEVSAVLTVAAIDPKGGMPTPDHSCWLSLAVTPTGWLRIGDRNGMTLSFP